MDDREFERTLARRLGDYEEQIPVGTQPGFGQTRSRGRRVAQMAAAAFAVVAAGAVVGLVAAVTVFAPREADVASGPSAPPSLPASSAVSASPSPSVRPAVSPTATTTATQSPVSQPTATPSIGLPSGEWTVVATRGDGSAVDHAALVTYGAAGFLAIGSRFEHGEGGPQFVEAYALRSLDGVAWEEIPAPPFRAPPSDLWVTPSGMYVVTGYQPGDSSNKNIDVLTSVDGITWEPAQTSLNTDVEVIGVDRGALGYLLMGSRQLGGSRTLGLASDGLDWELVHDFGYDDGLDPYYELDAIGAGDEGFVALGWRISDGVYERFAFASADGREWVETFSPFGAEPSNFVGTAVLAPLGPDWVAVVPQPDSALQVWTSPNGIAWERGTTIASVEIGSIRDPVLVNVDDTLYFSLGGDPSPGETGAWSSTDGVTWTQLDIGQGAASDAAAGAGVVVLTGHRFVDDGTGSSIATIWASPVE